MNYNQFNTLQEVSPIDHSIRQTERTPCHHWTIPNQARTTANCTQAKINRYENGNTEPPFPVLMWYADYFDVSLDYIFGRTDNPKGTTFEAIPKYKEENEDYKKFIEMCFDPTSPMHQRLKETMLNMIKEEE